MTNHKIGRIGLAAFASALAFGGAVATTTAASAQVTGCPAPGGRQEAGALIGAVVGGVIGSNVAKNERGLGTVLGAGAGAAAGSAIGCEQQKARSRTAYSGYSGRNAWVARSNLNIRARPSTSSSRVGSLYAGQRFQSLGATRDGRWVMVGRNGTHIGYVASAYVQPA